MARRVFASLALLFGEAVFADLPEPLPAPPEPASDRGWPGPAQGESVSAWRANLTAWTAATRSKAPYTGLPVYAEEALTWTRTSYMQPQVHPYDRFLFDNGVYTVDRYLDDLKSRYGGIDSVLLWPTYTNLGIDERNQFDYYSVLPGGLDGFKDLVAQFHSRGVKVLVGYNPWDQATRNRGGWPHWESLANFLKAVDADGFNGDTMTAIPRVFWDAAINVSHPIAFEPEDGAIPDPNHNIGWENLDYTPLGWGYFMSQPVTMPMNRTFALEPPVDRMKWLDPQGRHLTHVCDRWSKNRTAALQVAFFNGDGYETWENVWGMWIGITDRDAQLIHRVATILRWAGARNLIQSFDVGGWEPYTPDVQPAAGETLGHGLFASRFRRGNETLWLLVNKFSGANQLGGDVTATVRVRQTWSDTFAPHLLDLYHGQPLKARSPQDGTGDLLVDVVVEGLGIAAVLATYAPEDAAEVSSIMRGLSGERLDSFSSAWHILPQHMDPATTERRFKPAEAPENMVLVPRATYRFSVSGIEFEGGCDPTNDPNGVCCNVSCALHDNAPCNCAMWGWEDFGLDVQFPWESSPRRNHFKEMVLGPFLIDKDLVTNDKFLEYIQATNYTPAPGDETNFLKHWVDGRPRPGDEQKPVVNVGLEEARAFCRFNQKRLPHSYEWQYAAQGTDGRQYPWGQNWNPDAVPTEGHDPDPVGAHPAGDSPFGVRDMVGNVWQYTDSFRDAHTRAALVRGSSRFRPVVSSDFPASKQDFNWYFPPALELQKHGKYMLMSNSYERAGTLGFRCVADVEDGLPGPYHYAEPPQREEIQYV